MPCADSTQPLGASAIALDAVLILGTIIVPAPQMIKLARARSSQGLTPLTLCITLVFNACSVGSGLLSKWDQVEEHKWLHLLDLLQLVLLELSMGVVLLLCVSFPPNNTRFWRAAVAALWVLALGLLVVCVLLSVSDPCGATPLGLSRALGVAGAVSAVVQFLPQLRLTFINGSAGELSGAMYGIQVLGGYAICANLVFLEHETWQTWTPMLVSTSTQAGVLGLCCVFEWRRRQRLKLAVHAAREERDAPLLASAAEAPRQG
tara:strand:+ start:129 stop:914 length:786 start_codon:yes stop_codon:yes gene_type:complete